MTKIALITDTHWGVRNDNQHFIEYYNEFYKNVFFPRLEEEGIKHVLMLGDTFERRKYTNHVTLHYAKKYYFDELERRGLQAWMLIGNHDAAYKNTNYVNVPELALSEYDNITMISNEATTIEIDGTKICMVPWMNAENYQQCMQEMKDTKAEICCGHFEIKGFAMYRDSYSEEGLDRKIFKKFEYTFSGHYHHKSNSDGIHYLGNPYPLTWFDYGDERGFHILDLGNRDLEFIQNPYEMFVKFVYDDTDKDFGDILDHDVSNVQNKYVKIIVLNKTNPFAFDSFVDKIYKSNPADLSIVDEVINSRMDEDEESLESQDTLSILNGYIDGLTDNSIEPNRLKSLMREVYVEALNTESD